MILQSNYVGGGAMGIIEVIVTDHIEQSLGVSISSITTSFAGTSIGAALSVAYSLGKFTNAQLRDLFYEHADEVFKKENAFSFLTSKFGNKGLIEVMQKYFGETLLKECKKPTYLLARDIDVENLYISSETNGDMPCYKGVTASCSAPYIFKPYHFTYRNKEVVAYDGGLFAQDPSVYNLSMALKKGIDIKDIWSISFGSGYSKDKKRNMKNPFFIKAIAQFIDESLESQKEHSNVVMQNLLGERFINLDIEMIPEYNDMTKIQYMPMWEQKAIELTKSIPMYEAIRKLKTNL